MFFSKPGEYPPAGLFTYQHIILLVTTIILIGFFLFNSINKDSNKIKKIITINAIVLGILEIARIAFSLTYTSIDSLNGYMPLFFCSLFLYSAFFSAFSKGKLKRAGDVFIATGGLLGGLTFLICPSTSLPTFPAFHFLSLHSFLYHGTMVYMGLLYNMTNYISLKRSDLTLYSIMVGVLCLICIPLNKNFGSNLMFLSEPLPGKLGKMVHQSLGAFFPIAVSLFHMYVPFEFVYLIRKCKEKKQIKKV